ncbi:hypothetical protein J437_LFUL018349 [Ladona fulva]|uniref:Uncharacterized protein n=1 Tax=Ladona fulva TaxID=123851 RepID=A0A8K0KNJ3_LADFU|nr:hypothetical protein J437_LFUL018349 [Ladona fulva]
MGGNLIIFSTPKFKFLLTRMGTVGENNALEAGESDSIAISQALYICFCGQDGEKDLQLVNSGLPSDREHQLRLFLLRRLRKSAVYEGTGSCAGVDFR